MDIKALLAPFKTGRTLATKTPLLRHVLSRPLVAVPVRIRGELGNPRVTVLSPSSVGSELLGVLKRTLTLPVKVLEPVVSPPKQTPMGP